MVEGLQNHAGYPDMHDLTEVGAHPSRSAELLVDWTSRHLQFVLPHSGKPDERPHLGSDSVVVVIDAHNGLMGDKWTANTTRA